MSSEGEVTRQGSEDMAGKCVTEQPAVAFDTTTTTVSDGDAMTLEARQQRWGFTLDELRAATKVVSILFRNPALYLGDPYLADSRLYTMITRDRKTKRENREVFNAIMNEEKTRRKRYQRMQHIETIRKTAMKREREAALNALVLPDASRLAIEPAVPGNGRLPSVLPSAKTEASCDGVENANDGDEDPAAPGVSAADAQEDADTQLPSEQIEALRLVGAFENLLRLEQAYAGTFSDDGTQTDVATRRAYEGDGSSEAARRKVDWIAITQLTAQVYRYIPHTFGSQMPPPLLPGPVPPHLPEREWRYYIAGAKIIVARRAQALHQDTLRNNTCAEGAAGQAPTSAPVARGLHDLLQPPGSEDGDDLVVRAPMRAVLSSITDLRHGADGSFCCWTCAECSCAAEAIVRVARALPLLETALVAAEALSDDERALLRPMSANAVTSDEAVDFAMCDVAEQSLNLFIARRLYTLTTVRAYGESPVELQRAPPTSDSEEPDTYCVFDEVQRYASDVDTTHPGTHPGWTALKLNRWISCHTCKVRYNRLHPYYYSMCHLCGEYNYNKRLLTRDLRGKVILLTGCRIKIGYAMAISLLRCGAELLGITRFIHEAAARFQQEPDYAVWRHRLHLFSIDLRDLWIVTQFCAFVRQRFPKLFAIINNATQTIARTPQYTAHLRAIELHPAPELRAVIESDPVSHEWHDFFLRHSSVTVGQPLTIEPHPHAQPFLDTASTTTTAPSAQIASVSGTHVAGTSKNNNNNDDDESVVVVLPRAGRGEGGECGATTRHVSGAVLSEEPVTDETARVIVFDRYDTQAEESDLREKNSWVLRLAEVQGSEAAEVMAINALAPFILNSKLKPCLMNRHGDATPDEARFIINVSAMEGRFYQYKQPTHPHTNMAKAALNMMTRTSGEDYAQDGIYMNSVDTGWITDESPMLKKYRRAEQYLLCPLDEVDAAARCLDLIYTNSTAYGKFYKDYKEITCAQDNMTDYGAAQREAFTLPSPGTKFSKCEVEKVIRQVCDEMLAGGRYPVEEAQTLIKDLGNEIQQRIVRLDYVRYKFVTHVTVTEAAQQGIRIASRCLWDPETDNYASYVYSDAKLHVSVVVFGLYWE